MRTCTGTAVARAFGTVGHYCCLRPQIPGPFVAGLRSLARMLYYSVGLYCLRALVSPTHAVFLSREKRSIVRSSESHIRRVQYAAQDAGRSAPRLQRPRWRVRGRRSGSQSRPGRAWRSLGHGTEMRRAPWTCPGNIAVDRSGHFWIVLDISGSFWTAAQQNNPNFRNPEVPGSVPLRLSLLMRRLIKRFFAVQFFV